MLKKLILVYGSLRKYSSRGYNFERFGPHKYIDTLVIKGFEMYSLGSYPTICVSDDSSITVEVHEVDEKNYKQIEQMEVGAGYSFVSIETQYGPATLFIWDKKYIQKLGLKKVKSGNWS